MKSTYLLDVNVLIALLDSGHIFHDACDAWMASLEEQRWATCPITQIGVVRVLTSPKYPQPAAPQVAIALLRQVVELPGHMFIADDLGLCDGSFVPFDRIVGTKQITDAYLLGLSRKHGLKLATFDRRLGPALAPGEDIVMVI